MNTKRYSPPTSDEEVMVRFDRDFTPESAVELKRIYQVKRSEGAGVWHSFETALRALLDAYEQQAQEEALEGERLNDSSIPPCPFCGSAARYFGPLVESVPRWTWEIQCRGCHASVQATSLESSRAAGDAALAKWSQRSGSAVAAGFTVMAAAGHFIVVGPVNPVSESRYLAIWDRHGFMSKTRLTEGALEVDNPEDRITPEVRKAIGIALGWTGSKESVIRREQEDTPGMRVVMAERRRQLDAEGWSAAHDDEHDDESLAIVAACYAAHGVAAPDGLVRVLVDANGEPRDAWPSSWGYEWDKRRKHPRLRKLAIAGALIMAEIDRLLRRSLAQPTVDPAATFGHPERVNS